jgi:hypothetical protein
MEVGFRVRRVAQGWWQRMVWRPDFASSAISQPVTATPWHSRILEQADEFDPEMADSILAGQFQLLGLDELGSAWPPDWNQDPKSKVTAPLGFGKHIDYRNSDVVGDIKYVWEINRHLEFPVLAIAYKNTGDDKYLKALEQGLETWLHQCPFPQGVNWCSALESAIRIINWSFVWQILGGDDGDLLSSAEHRKTKASFLKSVAQHVLFIRRNYSGYSSANNHLIGEAAGVFVACNTWSFNGQSDDWAAEARSILVEETLRQIGKDGVGKEQAVGYVPFVLEFILIAGAVSRAIDVSLPDEYWQRIRSALYFLDSISDSAGNLANIGDADDGAVLRIWGYDINRRIEGLERLATALSAGKDQADNGRSPDPASDGGTAAPIAFDDGGYYVLRTRNKREQELHCVFDCGPLGYLATAAHGHADALSMTMNVDGHSVLVDPGTYAYHTKRPWRDYFRGTAAHNTVRIDKLDQSEIAGSFMWRRPAKARCELYSSDKIQQTVKASHDGYTRLSDPLVHCRQVQLFTEPQQVLVTDELICTGIHFVEMHWHLAPACLAKEEDGAFRVKIGSVEIVIRVDGKAKLQMDIVSGATDPIRGWYSDRYDQKTASTSLRWFGEISGTTELETRIEILRHR